MDDRMDSALSTICYLLGPSVATAPAIQNNPPQKNTPLSATSNPEDSTAIYPQTTRTDNTYALTQKPPENNPQQHFQNMLNQKVADKANQQTQNDSETNPNHQGLTPVAAQPAVIQQWLNAHIKNNNGPNKETHPKAGQKLAQLLAEVTGAKPASLPGQAANPMQNLSTKAAEKQNLGLNTAASKISNNLAPVNNLPASDKSTADTTNSPKQWLKETASGSANKLTDSGSPKSSNGKISTSEADDGENPTSTGKLENILNQKTSRLSSVTQNKTSPVSDKNQNSYDSSTDAAQKTTDNKTKTSQMPSELSNNNDKAAQPARNNSSIDPVLQKLNPHEVSVTADQTAKQRDASTSNNKSSSPFEQLPNQNSLSASSTEQTSPLSQTIAKNSGSPLPNNNPNINEQIFESIHSSLRNGDQQITIRLNPPELGKVTIKFQEQDDRITGLVEVSKAQTKAQIQQALPQLIKDLQDAGVPLKRLDVSLSNQSQPQTLKDQFLHDGGQNQQTDADVNNANSSNANSLLANSNSYLNASRPQNEYVTDNSINMLF